MNPAFGAAPGQYGQQQPMQGYGGAAYHGYEQSAMNMPPHNGILSGLTRKPFLRFTRRRMNVIPILICLFLPWVLFTVVFGVLSFSLHYYQPVLCNVIVAAAALVVVVIVVMAVTKRLAFFSSSEREPSWMFFLSFCMILALVLGCVLGNSNFKSYMKPFFNFHSLNSYTDVYPTRMRGQQLMDAGMIQFAEGTRLDVSMSMGFKSGTMYCVAPIVLGNETLISYDFWAVGTGCCSGNQADFHCKGWNSPKANGGLRLMSDGARGYYRLAVQQAESAYRIRAVHPLFFTWEVDPLGMVDDWKNQARSQFLVWMFTHLLFQAFLVASAVLIFSRLGHF